MKSLANWTWHVSNTFKRKIFFRVLEVYENLWLRTGVCIKLALFSIRTPTNKKFYMLWRIFWFKGKMCFWEESLNSHKLKWFCYLLDQLGLIKNWSTRCKGCWGSIPTQMQCTYFLEIYLIWTNENGRSSITIFFD